MASQIGFVYVMANDAMPDLIKVGHTLRSPHERAAELSRTTSAALPFQVLCYLEVPDPLAVERAVHDRLEEHRTNQSREFFAVDCLLLAVRLLWFHPDRLAFVVAGPSDDTDALFERVDMGTLRYEESPWPAPPFAQFVGVDFPWEGEDFT